LVPPISQPPLVVGIRWRVVCRNRPSTTRRAPEPRSPSSLPPPPSRYACCFSPIRWPIYRKRSSLPLS
jgi:hypothetical protein